MQLFLNKKKRLISSNHSKFWTSELALKQPMTKIDCQINLIMLANIEHVFFVLHIYCDKLIAYLWGMFTIVYLTKLFISDEMLYFRLFIQINSFAFNLLAPSIFIQTFSEKNHVRHNCFIVNFIDSIAHPIKV